MVFYDIVNNLFRKFMNLNPTEWSRAQDLLVKLVHALTPLTVKEVPASLFLTRRFFIPSDWMPDSADSPLLKQPIRLLTTLHSVQEQVEKWIGEAPQSSREVESGKKQAAPLSRQAEKLIAEVQEAIGKLSTSSFTKDPQEAPLREALKKLKPDLDRLIEAVSHDQESAPIPEASKSPFRHPLPRSSREEMVKKLLSLSEEKRAPKERTSSLQEGEKNLESNTSYEKIAPIKKEGEGTAQEKKVVKIPLIKESKAPLLDLEKGIEKASETLRVSPRPVEITSLPGAPIVPQTKELAPAPRKKKKRKGFWFKEEGEERDRS